jgi:cyclophilin family peptidyl-prolyl cis-trans isomerase
MRACQADARRRWWKVGVMAAALVAAACGTVRAQVAAPATKPADTAAAQAEFAAASKEMKDLVGELTVLQAQYQQPKADKAALEARFEAVKVKAQATSARLEQAAFALAIADPKNAEAREISGAAVAGALQGDDPRKALALAERLDGAGAGGGDVALMAATAAMIVSDVDAAEAWLKKAEAAGAAADRLGELRQAAATERAKVAPEMAKRAAEAKADDLPRVKLTTSQGAIVVELFENEAPNTVANFIALVEKGFYAGTPFHRVIPGFMAQGGDPTGTGTSGPGYAIACECDAPGARKHFLGTLSMAHAGKDTGGSQFFLTFRPTEHLDGKHTVFGRVIEGFDVLPLLMRTQDEQGRSMAGIKPDVIVKAEVVRKRNHPYEPKTLPDPRKR